MKINELRKLLKVKKITQADIAKILNITASGVNYLFQQGDMKCSQLEAIAEYIGVSPAIFLETPSDQVAEPLINYQKIVGTGNVQVNDQAGKLSRCLAEVEKLKTEIQHLNNIIREKDLRISSQQDLIQILKGNLNLD